MYVPDLLLPITHIQVKKDSNSRWGVYAFLSVFLSQIEEGHVFYDIDLPTSERKHPKEIVVDAMLYSNCQYPAWPIMRFRIYFILRYSGLSVP